jgi:hypothetical protein
MITRANVVSGEPARVGRLHIVGLDEQRSPRYAVGSDHKMLGQPTEFQPGGYRHGLPGTRYRLWALGQCAALAPIRRLALSDRSSAPSFQLSPRLGFYLLHQPA